MTTTFERFRSAKRANYSTLPTIDVEILPDVRECRTCGLPVRYQPHPRGSSYGPGTWVHDIVGPEPEPHYVSPKDRCSYCHGPARYIQHAWHDAVECDRCGGVTGYAIGD